MQNSIYNTRALVAGGCWLSLLLRELGVPVPWGSRQTPRPDNTQQWRLYKRLLHSVNAKYWIQGVSGVNVGIEYNCMVFLPQNNCNPVFVIRGLTCNTVQELQWDRGDWHFGCDCGLGFKEEHVFVQTNILAIRCGLWGTIKNQ